MYLLVQIAVILLKETGHHPPRMADEAEKLINLSLCKMAESRTTRRGGTSLHKHLLISKVLNKARSAYFDTWYMGDGEIIDERSGQSVDMNSSYQELEFPLDDDDDDEDDEDDTNEFDLTDPSLVSTSYYAEMPSLPLQVTSSSSPDPSSALTNNNEANDKKLTDARIARYFVGTENESEIELPSDILSCVEKMGDSCDMSFGVDDSISASSPPNTSTNVMVVSTTNVLIETGTHSHQSDDNCLQSTQLVYLDLDSAGYATTTEPSSNISTLVEEEKSFKPELDNDEELIFGSPCHTSTPRPNAPKRRRNWSLEDSDSDDEEDERVHDRQSSSSKFCSFRKTKNSTKANGVTKRLRFSPSPEKEEQNADEPDTTFLISQSSSPIATISITKSNEFRTKKSHFEEDEQEESEDDPFSGDALLSQNPYDSNSIIPSRKNDQRVPSASGGSSSDEDQEGDLGGERESSMDVDQITNLVQFISFNKNQTRQQPLENISPSSSVTSSSTSSEATSTSCGPSQQSPSDLVRSISSPDLCGFVSSQSSSAKNIFTYNRTSNNNHTNPISHRVLSMKV